MNFEPQTMTAAWPTLFFSYKYKNYQQNKDKLLDLIYDMSNKQNEDIDSGVSASLKSNLKESKFNFLETQTPEVQDLKLFFNNCISNIMTHGLSSTGLFSLDQNVKPAVQIKESWYHITNDNGSHGFHIHPGYSWGAIFYLQSSECSTRTSNGINRFYNMNTVAGANDLGSQWWEQHMFLDAEPEEGTVFIFPAWIPHEATKYNGAEDRVIISVNTNVFGEL